MFNVWLLFSFMMSVKLQAVSLIRADINQTGSLMERRMQCDYIKKSPKHGVQIKVQVENVLMLGEGGFVVGSRLIFLSKAVLHFDYLVFLKAIQVGPVSLRFVFLGLGLFFRKRACYLRPYLVSREAGKTIFFARVMPGQVGKTRMCVREKIRYLLWAELGG